MNDVMDAPTQALQKYRITFRCTDCGHKFQSLTVDRDFKPDCPECRKAARRSPAPGDGAVSDADLQPIPERDKTVKGIWKCEAVECGERFACPQWNAAGEAITPKACPLCANPKVKFLQTTAPSKVTEKGLNQNRAIETTAEITMANHGLTDLKDDVRMGETMAPSLRPDLQRQADSFFDRRPGAQNPSMNRILGNSMQAHGNAALSRQAYTPEAGMIHAVRDSAPKFSYTPIATHKEDAK